jgi:PPOX class probable F420-dependent enzyme
MDLRPAVDFASANRWSVLTTIRKNGRPQLSNVAHHAYAGSLLRISITADRAKYHNLLRDPWAALHVTQPDFSAYVVLEGTAELSPIATQPDDETVEELVTLYRDVAGEHEDWDQFRQAMVMERRAVIRLSPVRAYGMLSLPPPSGT